MESPGRGGLCALVTIAALFWMVQGVPLAGEQGSGPQLQVLDGQGRTPQRARVRCIEPPTPPRPVGAEGRAAVPDGCRRAECLATGFLPARIDLTGQPAGAASVPCRVVPGLRLRVSASAAAGAAIASVRLFRGSAAGPDAAPERSASFSMGDGPRLAELGTVPPGSYRIEVSRPESDWRCWTSTGPLPAGLVTVPSGWRDPATIAGRVVDADGRGRSGIPIRAHEGRPRPRGPVASDAADVGRWACAPIEPPSRARSDDRGRFSLRVDPGRESLLVAGSWHHPAGVAARAVGQPPDPDAGLRLSLQRPARLRARLLHPDDSPATCRAEVRVADGLGPWLTEVLGGSLETECDADGLVSAGPFRARPLAARLFPRGGLPLIQRVDAPAPGETIDLGVLRVPEGERVMVSVVDDAGAPVEGAQAVVRGRSAIVLHASGTTDRSGRATIAGLPKGSRMSLKVSAEGYLKERRTGLTADDFPYEVTLSRGAGLAGVVIDRHGSPIPGAEVTVQGDGEGPAATEPVDARGRFRIDDAPEGSLRLLARARGYHLVEPLSVEAVAGEWSEDLVLEMEPEPLIRGRVLDSAGQPLAGAEVSLVDRWALESLGSSPPQASTLTDGDGKFSLARVESDQVVLVAQARGHGAAVDRAPLAGGGEPVTLTLPKAAAARIVLPGSASGEVKVSVVDGVGVGSTKRVYVEGSAPPRSVRFEDLSPGRARARMLPGPVAAADLTAGTETEIRLEQGALIEGHVVHRGQPVARAVVNAAPRTPRGVRFGQLRYSGQDGRFRIDGLEPGRYLVVAESDRGRAERPVELEAGERREVRLEVERIRLRVRVRDAEEGTPLDGARVRAEWAGFEGDPSVQGIVAFPRDDLGFDMVVNNFGGDVESTGSNGLAVLSLPREGEFRIAVNREGYEPAQQNLDIGRGSTPLAIALERATGGRLRVRLVTDPPGQRGSVLVTGPSTQLHYASGQAVFEDLTPGRYQVVFYVDGFGAGTSRADVGAVEEASARVVARRGGTLVVPVSGPDVPMPVVRDAKGRNWSALLDRLGVPGQEIVRMEERPEAGPAWILPALPPGIYTVSDADGERQPVSVDPGAVAVAW